MAVTITPVLRTRDDKNFTVCVTVAADASYPTGGWPITANQLGLGTALFGLAGTQGGYVFRWDNANLKLMAYYSDYDAVADGALIQVPNATDISATATLIPLMVMGY